MNTYQVIDICAGQIESFVLLSRNAHLPLLSRCPPTSSSHVVPSNSPRSFRSTRLKHVSVRLHFSHRKAPRDNDIFTLNERYPDSNVKNVPLSIYMSSGGYNRYAVTPRILLYELIAADTHTWGAIPKKDIIMC